MASPPKPPRPKPPLRLLPLPPLPRLPLRLLMPPSPLTLLPLRLLLALLLPPLLLALLLRLPLLRPLPPRLLLPPRRLLPRSNWQHFRPMPENKKPALGLAFFSPPDSAELAPGKSELLIGDRDIARPATQRHCQSCLRQFWAVVLFAQVRGHHMLQALTVNPL